MMAYKSVQKRLQNQNMYKPKTFPIALDSALNCENYTSALLRRSKVQCVSSLHLDGIPLLERVVQDARRVDDLPPQVLVIGVPHEERLGGEGVGLHLDVGARYLVDEARLADVGEAGYQDGPRVRVDGWKTTEMLTDLQFGVKSIVISTLLNVIANCKLQPVNLSQFGI